MGSSFPFIWLCICYLCISFFFKSKKCNFGGKGCTFHNISIEWCFVNVNNEINDLKQFFSQKMYYSVVLNLNNSFCISISWLKKISMCVGFKEGFHFLLETISHNVFLLWDFITFGIIMPDQNIWLVFY